MTFWIGRLWTCFLYWSCWLQLPYLPNLARVWTLESSSLYTYKSFLSISLKPNNYPFPICQGILEAPIPSKMKIFTRTSIHQKLNTNDLLQVRHPHWNLSPVEEEKWIPSFPYIVLLLGSYEGMSLVCLILIGDRSNRFLSTFIKGEGVSKVVKPLL